MPGLTRILPLVALLLFAVACERSPDVAIDKGALLGPRQPTLSGPPARAGEIAFHKGPFNDEELWSVAPDGSGLTRLTDNAVSDADAAWYPHGPHLAFARGPAGIWTLNTRSGRARLLSDAPANDAWPAVQPRGSGIVFASTRDGGDWDLFVMDSDGSGLVQLTANAESDRNANWSPDGTRIVFESDRDGDDDIYVMNADGSGVVQLTDDPDQDIRPDFSPDGGRIAFTSNRDANPEIWLMNPDGSALQQVTFTDGLINTDPSWSPDGSRIVFARRVPNTNDSDIWVVEVATGIETRLTFDGNGNRDPDWMP